MELEIEKLARWIRATTYNCTGGLRWGSQSYHPKITDDFPIEDFWLNLAREALKYQQERVDAAMRRVHGDAIENLTKGWQRLNKRLNKLEGLE